MNSLNECIDELDAEREKVRVLEIEDARKQGVLEAIYENLESPDVYADLETEQNKVRVLRDALRKCNDAMGTVHHEQAWKNAKAVLAATEPRKPPKQP